MGFEKNSLTIQGEFHKIIDTDRTDLCSLGWENLRLEHQLYNAGHFFEMAVEHNRLTGKSNVLNAARRFADHIDGIFGPGKRYDVGGHEEVELALDRTVLCPTGPIPRQTMSIIIHILS